jgi:heme/copper-type cytochrome/quinol oxidase subunit 2
VSAAVLVFWLCVVCCVVGHVAILVSVIRRHAPVAGANVPRPRMAVEILWALIPAVALAFLLTVTWVRVREHASPKPDVMMKVAR